MAYGTEVDVSYTCPHCGETVTDTIKTLKIVWQRYMTTNVQNAVNPATWMWICNNQNNIML